MNHKNQMNMIYYQTHTEIERPRYCGSRHDTPEIHYSLHSLGSTN